MYELKNARVRSQRQVGEFLNPLTRGNSETSTRIQTRHEISPRFERF